VCRSLDIPANLDLDKLLGEHPFNKPNNATKDKIAFICNTIYYLMREQKKKLAKQNGYIYVQSKIIKQYIPDYHKYIKYLLAANVIMCNKTYRNNYYSKGYKFSDYYPIGTQKHTIRSCKFAQHIDTCYIIHEHNEKKRLNKASHLQIWFNENLHFDKKKAKRWIHDSYVSYLHAIEDANIGCKEYDDAIEKVNARHRKYTKAVYNFELNKLNYNYSIDKIGLRYQTILVHMNKRLRNFIKYNGERLVEFDNKTSQPYFSLLIFQPRFYFTRESKDALTLKKLHPVLYKRLKEDGSLIQLQKIARDVNKSTSTVSDVKSYQEDILKKDFYQVIADFIPGTQSREIGKDQIFSLLFEDWDNVNYGTPYIKAFRKKYPTVFKVFSILKRRKHNEFAGLLQRIESEVMYRTTRAFCDMYPNAPIYTIHDNYITTVSYKQHLRELLATELEKWTGYKPKLSETNWKPENAKIEIEI